MNYRREIDGLRAVAVLPVIFFHAGFDSFGGGFVGVDVFFVISGYLITTIILVEKQAGTFSLVGFYERRARRILPALFVVMLVCLPFAWFWMLPNDLKEFSQSLVAVSVFVSNILFWRESGYFATANELKPLLHTWSLAIEEQYYLLYPLLIMLFWRLGLRWITGLFAVAAMISLAAAEWSSTQMPVAAFYLLPTRGWELLVGAFIAFFHFNKSERTDLTPGNQTGSLFGFALITYAVFALDKHTPYPSLYTLIPTLGTALIILFATPQTILGKVLGSKWLVGMGLISYSAYLWHQPLFSFARLRSIETPSSSLLALLAVFSIVLAYLSWRFIERPFRDRSKTRKYIFFSAALMTIVMISLGSVGYVMNGFAGRFELPAHLVSSFEKTDRALECFDKDQVHTRHDWLCDVGNKQGDTNFFVFGDSHSLALLPAFDQAANTLNMRGVYAGASSCLPFLAIHALRGDQNERDCHLLNPRVFDYIRQNHIKKVFLVARWTYYTDGGYDGANFSFIGTQKNSVRKKGESRRAFRKGLKETITEYKRLGVEVIVVTQVPQQKCEPKSIYYRAYAQNNESSSKNIQLQSVRLDEHRALQSFVNSLFSEYQTEAMFKVLSFDSIFCDNTICAVGDERESYYSDNDHLSKAGARLVVDEISKNIRD